MELSVSRRTIRRLVVYGLLAALVAAVSMTGIAERLFYLPTRAETPLPQQPFLHPEKVTFPSRDGTQLTGWFIPCAQGNPREAATVLHVHGNAGNMNSHFFFVEWLPYAGFNVMMFDFRGYGESEGTAWRREGLLQDTLAALQYLRSRSEVDPKRIALFGVSLGGALAVVAAAADASDAAVSGGAPPVAAVVLEAPFCSWRQVAASAVGGPDPAWHARALAWLLIRDATSSVPRPDEAIKSLACPVLIIHGDADTTVPISHGRALAAAGKNAKLIEYAGGQHNSLQETHPLSRSAIIQFLRERFGGHMAPRHAK